MFDIRLFTHFCKESYDKNLNGSYLAQELRSFFSPFFSFIFSKIAKCDSILISETNPSSGRSTNMSFSYWVSGYFFLKSLYSKYIVSILLFRPAPGYNCRSFSIPFVASWMYNYRKKSTINLMISFFILTSRKKYCIHKFAKLHRYQN